MERAIVGAVLCAWLRALRTSTAEGTQNTRAPERVLGSRAIGTQPELQRHLVISACKRKPPRMCWSGCSLLVDDLKAAATLLSSVVAEAGCQRLQAIVIEIDVPCMEWF